MTISTYIAEGEVVLTKAEAEALTQRIGEAANALVESFETLQALVAEARNGEAHKALGYKSWPEYLAKTLGAHKISLKGDDRKELVAYLNSEGLSARAIAPIVGASRETVRQDMAGDKNLSPAEVTGLDGKTYRPKASPETLERIGRMIEDGMNNCEIAREVGLGSNTIRNIRKKLVEEESSGRPAARRKGVNDGRILKSSTPQIQGIVTALEFINNDRLDTSVDPETARNALDAFTRAIQELTRINKLLKKEI